MRWLVKKVVKWVIEALVESEGFDQLIERLASKMPVGGVQLAGSQTRERLVAADNTDDGIDSSMALAQAIISGTGKVEMSELPVGSTVVSNEGKKDVMDMLKKI